MPIQRSDTILCQLPTPSTGLSQFKLRPAIIVSKNINNRRLDDVMVAPCTSNVSRSQEPTQYLISGAQVNTAGIHIPSVVRCEALMTIPKTMIVRTLGHLSDAALDAINACLRDALML